MYFSFEHTVRNRLVKVIEFINGYDLFELSNRVGGMNEIHVRHIMRQIVDIVVTLARHQIVHRDIKDENIMINELSQGKCGAI